MDHFCLLRLCRSMMDGEEPEGPPPHARPLAVGELMKEKHVAVAGFLPVSTLALPRRASPWPSPRQAGQRPPVSPEVEPWRQVPALAVQAEQLVVLGLELVQGQVAAPPGRMLWLVTTTSAGVPAAGSTLPGNLGNFCIVSSTRDGARRDTHYALVCAIR